MTSKSWFKQSDVTRMIKGVMAAGYDIHSIHFDPATRTVSVITAGNQSEQSRANPLDRLHR